MRVSSATAGGYIDIYDVTSTPAILLGTCKIGTTKGWDIWAYETCNVNLSGKKKISIQCRGSSGYLFNIDEFKFIHNPYYLGGRIEAEDYDSQNGILVGDDFTQKIKFVGWTNTNDYISFKINTGLKRFNSFKACVSSHSAGGYIELRTQIPDGYRVIATLSVPSTGSWNNWQMKSVSLTENTIGSNITLVFKGGSGYILNIDWFQFE